MKKFKHTNEDLRIAKEKSEAIKKKNSKKYGFVHLPIKGGIKLKDGTIID